ncbi:MAG: glycosyltransferase family 9 protein [Ignavibacteriae bacterium]|nr:glycosyltransferase family 9 protein [Ignavibacteriota bacterium]
MAKSIDPDNIKNILVSRTDRIGDVVLTLPLVSECKRNFRNAKIWFLVSEYIRDLIEGYPDVDELVFKESFNSGGDLRQFLKSAEIDLIIHAYPRPDISLAAFRAGIENRVGTSSRWYSFAYNHRVAQHRSECKQSEMDYNLDLLESIIDETDYTKIFKFKYTGDEKLKLFEKLKTEGLDEGDKYVIIHPGSGGSAKDLPLEKFKEIDEGIVKLYPDYKIVITGTEQEKDIAKQISGDRNYIDLTGKINLRELMILIDGCQLFMSNSTGPIHIAGALNKKIIGFYPNSRPINATRWGPPGDNNYIFTPKDDSDEMNKIEVNEVIDKVKDMLK